MNFGYPNTPYAPIDNMNMPNMSNMQYGGYPTMPASGCGCADNMTITNQYVQPGCNQMLQKCFVEEIPYYVNYNTHAVSNLCYIKRSKNAKKVPKSVQNGVFLDKNCNFSPFTSSVLN